MAFKALAFDSSAKSHVRKGQHTAEARGVRKNARRGRDTMREPISFREPDAPPAFPIE